ncbi:uncharacterized protein LOC132718562 [Ruditapes philippinarum]|uniref:uncharacterized protein LOC132718562 n=1 Tax=Ruditapes philippinarum TaxID=129788 RepID=UPI00295B70D3|nr:uncharacterized protein LOC132718562 [Ruditapes philippinarum]
MECYFKLALLLGSVYMTGCQVQQMTELTIHNLLTRVRDLEIAVKQLVEIQNSQAGNSYTNTITPTTALPDVPLPLNMLEGFTLGNSGDEKGFHVTLANDVTVGYGNKIKFDRIVENMGGAYNTVNSEFTCPTSGTYLLSLNIACERGSYVETSIEIRNSKGLERHILNSVCDHRKRTLKRRKRFILRAITKWRYSHCIFKERRKSICKKVVAIWRFKYHFRKWSHYIFWIFT